MNKLPLLKPKTTLQSSKCKEEINKLKKKKYCCFLSSLYLASQLLRIWRGCSVCSGYYYWTNSFTKA